MKWRSTELPGATRSMSWRPRARSPSRPTERRTSRSYWAPTCRTCRPMAWADKTRSWSRPRRPSIRAEQSRQPADQRRTAVRIGREQRPGDPIGGRRRVWPPNQFVVVNRSATANSGTVRTFKAAAQWPDVNYANVQVVSPNVASPAGQPNLLLLGPDVNEPNETLANSAFLGSGAKSAGPACLDLPQRQRSSSRRPADQDYYRVVAQPDRHARFPGHFKLFDPSLLPAGGT